MIAKISQGKGFRGALDYVLKADSETIGGNMAGKSARELAAEFGVTRALREDIDTCCYHVALSLPAGEKLSSGEWEKVTAKYLSRMGLSPMDHQYIVVRHKDRDFDHVHILTSRIALDGKVWKPFQDRVKSKAICRQLEKEHGLAVVSNEKKQHKAKTTQKERRMAARTGREPEKVFVQKKMNEILTEGASLHPQSFCSELEKHGIIAIPNVATTGKMNGFSFQYGGRSYTGSQVGYSWKHLEKFIEIAPEDTAWMQERKSRLQEGTPSDAVRSIRNAVWEVGIIGVPFDVALEKQGWTLKDGKITKGSVSFELASVVDATALKDNLDELTSYSKKVKEQAQAKSRALAKHYHARPRRTFLAEMRTEDMICAMLLFPQVTVFLLALSVFAEVARNMENPKDEAEFRERMRGIWKEADEAVQLEVSRIKEEMKNAGIARRNPANQLELEEAGRGLRTADESGQSSVREVGESLDSTALGVKGSAAGDEGGGKAPAVETKNPDVDGDIGVRRGSGAVITVIESAGSESSNDATSVALGGAVEEWANLAQDISALTRGEDEMPKEKSKSVSYKESVWDRQHGALQSPFYRLTVRGRGDEDGKVINLGKNKDKGVPNIDSSFGRVVSNAKGEAEILWTAEGVKSKIPTLEYWNAKGYDVYLTPMDEHHHYILLDDLTETGKEHVKKTFLPCLMQTSSEDNFQAVLRIPKAEVSSEEQSCANILLQELNQGLPDGCGGDKKISGAIHAFRMTGFHNKKPGKNNVQTKIELVRNTDCDVASRAFEDVKRRREEARTEEAQTRVRIEAKARKIAIETVEDRTAQRPEGETAVDKDFRFRWNRISGLARKKVGEGLWEKVDASTVDYRVCRELLQAGYSEQDTATALHRCSPDLYVRHWNPVDYINRTVSAAMQSILKDETRVNSGEAQR